MAELKKTAVSLSDRVGSKIDKIRDEISILENEVMEAELIISTIEFKRQRLEALRMAKDELKDVKQTAEVEELQAIGEKDIIR
jgi:hypothetical protein